MNKKEEQELIEKLKPIIREIVREELKSNEKQEEIKIETLFQKYLRNSKNKVDINPNELFNDNNK